MTELGSTGWVLESEFASVVVRVDGEANGARLRVEDLRTGTVRFFDPLELESLAHLTDDRLTVLLDPSSDRWRHDT
ncbi:MAG: hypothetical protein ACJ72L_18435 [Marmoricola sp.]